MPAKKSDLCEECFPGGWPLPGDPDRVSCEHGEYDAPKSSS